MTTPTPQISEREIEARLRHWSEHGLAGVEMRDVFETFRLAAAVLSAASLGWQYERDVLKNNIERCDDLLWDSARRRPTEQEGRRMILKLETWTSSDGKTEQHYYVPNGTYEGTYVVGFNPNLLSPDTRDAILELVEQDLKNVRPLPHRP